MKEGSNSTIFLFYVHIMLKNGEKEEIEVADNKTKKNEIKTVDQLSIAKIIADKTGLTIAEVTEVIELEQKLTMNFIKRGRKVIKKNYLILTPTIIKGKTLRCPINGEVYEVEARRGVSIRVGRGFKAYINDNKMPSKMCRFVDGVETEVTVHTDTSKPVQKAKKVSKPVTETSH